MTRAHLASRILSVAIVATAVGCGSGAGQGASDAAPDRLQTHEAGPRDAGSDSRDSGRPSEGGEAGACTPSNLAGFTPTFRTPVGPYAGACTTQQITDVVNDCFGPSSTMPACDEWVNATANAGCLNCWSGPEVNAIWTPVIYADNGGQEILIDVGGCIALADPAQKTCAQAIEYVMQCELAACLASCPIPANNDLTALGKCSAEADMKGCSSYVATASVCETNLAVDASTSPAAFCFDAFKSSSDLMRFFQLSCGPLPLKDGGGEGG